MAHIKLSHIGTHEKTKEKKRQEILVTMTHHSNLALFYRKIDTNLPFHSIFVFLILTLLLHLCICLHWATVL